MSSKIIRKPRKVTRKLTANYIATIKDCVSGDKMYFMPGRLVGSVELWVDGQVLAAFYADDLSMMATLLEQIEMPAPKAKGAA